MYIFISVYDRERDIYNVIVKKTQIKYGKRVVMHLWSFSFSKVKLELCYLKETSYTQQKDLRWVAS